MNKDDALFKLNNGVLKYKDLDDELKKDIDIVAVAFAKDKSLANKIDPELLENKDFLLNVIGLRANRVSFVPPKYFKDKDFIKTLFENEKVFAYIDKSFHSDIASVLTDDEIIMYALIFQELIVYIRNKELLTKDILLRFIQNRSFSIVTVVDDNMLDDSEIIEAMLFTNRECFSYLINKSPYFINRMFEHILDKESTWYLNEFPAWVYYKNIDTLYYLTSRKPWMIIYFIKEIQTEAFLAKTYQRHSELADYSESLERDGEYDPDYDVPRETDFFNRLPVHLRKFNASNIRDLYPKYEKMSIFDTMENSEDLKKEVDKHDLSPNKKIAEASAYEVMTSDNTKTILKPKETDLNTAEYEMMKQNIKNSFDNNKKDILEIDISKLNDKQKKYVMQKYSEIIMFITTGKKKRGFYFYFTWVFIILMIIGIFAGNSK